MSDNISFVNYLDTMKLIGVSLPLTEEASLRVDDNTEQSSIANFMLTKPRGIIIEDSFNNIAFPIRPLPRIDTKQFDLKTIYLRYREEYTQFDPLMLPWHYVIELVNDRYYAFNTRPITMEYPLDIKDIEKRQEKLLYKIEFNESTKKYFINQPFEITQSIHICLCGDSTKDVYPKNFYRVLSQYCIRPFLHYFKLAHSKNRVATLNLGSKFNFDWAWKFIYSK